ncbi:MAG: hypothetical protein ACKVT2_04430 [Saprospiraceae bacterium]
MTTRLKISFVCLWMAALLSASIGISVQQVYCYCLGKSTVSLFSAEDACQIPDDNLAPIGLAQDCCTKQIAATSPSCCKKDAPEKQGCTKKTTQVHQLKVAFEVVNPLFKKLEPPTNWGVIFSQPSFSSPFFVAYKHERRVFEHPPPSPSGRMICVLHGVFLC